MKTRTMTFFEMKMYARRLTFRECMRHARVSVDNRHRCNSCFTCACVEVIREQKFYKAWTGTESPKYINLSVVEE